MNQGVWSHCFIEKVGVATGERIIQIGHDGQLTLFHVGALERTVTVWSKVLTRIVSKSNRLSSEQRPVQVVLAHPDAFIDVHQFPVCSVASTRPLLR